MFPYKVHIVQEFEDRNNGADTSFADFFLGNIQSDSSFFNCILYSADFVFNVDGRVNNHNVRISGPKTYRDIYKWHEIAKNYMPGAQCQKNIIRKYYFDEPAVSGARCLHLLCHCFLLMLQTLTPDILFQQYGAPSHCSREVLAL